MDELPANWQRGPGKDQGIQNNPNNRASLVEKVMSGMGFDAPNTVQAMSSQTTAQGAVSGQI